MIILHMYGAKLELFLLNTCTKCTNYVLISIKTAYFYIF